CAGSDVVHHRADRRGAAGAGPRGVEDRRRRLVRGERGVCGRGAGVHAGAEGAARKAERARRRDFPRPPNRLQRRADSRHAPRGVARARRPARARCNLHRRRRGTRGLRGTPLIFGPRIKWQTSDHTPSRFPPDPCRSDSPRYPMSNFLWRPEDQAWTRDSHVARFMRTRGLSSLAELRRASVHCVQWFWDEALRDMGLEWTQRYTQVRDDSRGFAWTRWFVRGEINVTHNCIDRHVRDGHGGEVALYYEPDSGRPADARRVTFAELADLVNRCALALRAAGVTRGDSVGCYAPMQVPTVVVMFATMKLGARFVPIFCGYGEEALRERLALCDAKILFACGTLHRRGKPADTGALARAAAAKVSTLTRIVWTDTDDWKNFLESGGCIVPQ